MTILDSNILIYAYNRTLPNIAWWRSGWSGLLNGPETAGLDDIVGVATAHYQGARVAETSAGDGGFSAIREWLGRPECGDHPPWIAAYETSGETRARGNAAGSSVSHAALAALAT